MQPKYLEVDFGSRKVKFYALDIGQIQEYEEELKVLMGVGKSPDEFVFSSDRFAKMQRIYTASARRGDPTITEDDIKKIVDLSNLALVNKAVLGQTFGPQELAEGEEGVPTRPLTGAISTAA